MTIGDITQHPAVQVEACKAVYTQQKAFATIIRETIKEVQHRSMASLSSSRVALVTGANQGIGLEIVRQLSKKFDGVVLLAG